MKIRGGVKELRGGQIATGFTSVVLLAVVAFLVIMAAIMWGGLIHFATTQDLNLTASLLTTVAVLLMFYSLYLLTAAAGACNLL